MATAAQEPKAPLKRTRRETRNDGGSALSTYGLLAPMLIVLGLFFLAPLYYILLFSIALRRFSPTEALAALNGELNGFTTELWGKLVSVDVIVKLPGIDLTVPTMVIAVIIAIPVAYFLAFCVGKSKYTWMLIVIAPFLTSYLLRVFAWKVILGDQGLINSGLMAVGLVDEAAPLTFLIYSQFTVIVVLTYAWVPFICLPIFLSFETIDRRLLEAAMDLGASRWQAFRKISLPIIAPGIVAAFLFVFIPSIGEYITPTLVGGTQGTMYGQSLASQFVGGAFNWQYGSVMALFLLGVVLLLTFATSRFLRSGAGGNL